MRILLWLLLLCLPQTRHQHPLMAALGNITTGVSELFGWFVCLYSSILELSVSPKFKQSCRKYREDGQGQGCPVCSAQSFIASEDFGYNKDSITIHPCLTTVRKNISICLSNAAFEVLDSVVRINRRLMNLLEQVITPWVIVVDCLPPTPEYRHARMSCGSSDPWHEQRQLPPSLYTSQSCSGRITTLKMYRPITICCTIAWPGHNKAQVVLCFSPWSKLFWSFLPWRR
jgi:hypothetical protein